jgi:hypothetical protein
MMLKLSSVFLFFISLFLLSCEKELSFEGGVTTPAADTAVFTLGGSPSSCTGFTAAGTYIADIPLVASNTVALNVTVNTIGSYTVNTGTVNGITFSTSGNFTSTGSQVITLQGVGTPTAAGDFTYTVSNGGSSSCSLIITVVPAVSVAIGTVDCAGVTLSGTYTQGIVLGSDNTVSIPVNVITAGSYSVTTAAVNGCTFSASGILAAGAQTIVLAGSGTPTASGSSDYNFVFGASNCSFSIDFLPGILPSTDYFRCKIDGVLKTFNTDLKADPAEIFSGVNTVAISGIPVAGSDEYLDITVNSLSPVGTGTYPHGLGLVFSTSYNRDENSMGWQPGDNSSPPFSVVVTSKTATRIMGTFSGQYIDLNGTGTNTKQITEGEFSVPIQ